MEEQGQGQGQVNQPEKIMVDDNKLFGDDFLDGVKGPSKEQPDTSKDKPGEEGESNPGQKANTEPPESGDENQGSGSEQTEGGNTTETGDNTPANENQLLSAYSDYLKSIDENFEVPENLKKENLTNEEIVSTFTDEIFKRKVEADPYLKNYLLKRGQDNFSQDEFESEFATEKQLLGEKDPDKFLFNIMKIKSQYQEKNWSDESISKYINSLNEVEKDNQVDQYKSSIKNNLDAKIKLQNDSIIKARQKQFEAEESENEKAIKIFAESLASGKEKPVIEMSQDEMSEFVKDAPNLIKRDFKTGMNLIEELLNNDNFFKQVLPIIYKHYKGNLQGYTTSTKEKVKDDIIRRNLRPNPENFSRSASRTGSTKVDESLLYSDD